MHLQVLEFDEICMASRLSLLNPTYNYIMLGKLRTEQSIGVSHDGSCDMLAIR